MNENPWKDGVLVTSSKTKCDLAARFGISTVPSLADYVVKAESLYNQKNGHGMLVPNSPDYPYPLSTAIAKATSLLGLNLPNIPHLVTDSVYMIHLPYGCIAINKPKETHYPQKLVRLYRQYPGVLISSDTGIVRIRDGILDLYFLTLKLGRISPDFDLGRVFNTIVDNPSLAAGMSFLHMVDSGLLIPKKIIPYQFYRYDDKPSLIGGGWRPFDGIKGDLTFDATNLEKIMGLSLGLLPY